MTGGGAVGQRSSQRASQGPGDLQMQDGPHCRYFYFSLFLASKKYKGKLGMVAHFCHTSTQEEGELPNFEVSLVFTVSSDPVRATQAHLKQTAVKERFQQVRASASKLEDLSWIPGPSVGFSPWTPSCKLSSDVHRHTQHQSIL